ncbi:MAG: hypothetical protein PHF11_01185 [Candidatus Omnitrophica bacterium]|nr:hypothetical protein [Candidatus Omnitrophota bacterium]
MLSKAKENLSKIDFAVINSKVIDNNSELNFIKYVSQGRNDTKLLNLSCRNKLEGIAATTLLLKKSGIQPDSPDENIMDEANKLLKFVNEAYQNGISLEPKDINRNLRHEIILIEEQMHRYLVKCLKGSKDKYKSWDIIFISMYALGSLLLIIGQFKQRN